MWQRQKQIHDMSLNSEPSAALQRTVGIAAVQNRSRLKNKCKPNDMKQKKITSAGHRSNTYVRRSTVNKYRCPCCQRIFKRKDVRQWIKSYCTATEQTTRLIIQK